MAKKDIVDNVARQEAVAAKIDSVDVKLLADNVGVVLAYTTFILNLTVKK
jgi:hypothetical protein